MFRPLIFLLFLVFAFSCKNDNSNLAEIKNGFYIVQAIGELKNGSYTFCGTMPKEVNYTYRIGTWKFITKEKVKIAEGEYDLVMKENDSSGGCGFKYYENIVDLGKWKFWNKNGQSIDPTERLINLIESEQIDHSFYIE